jgi:hypothetical protein
MQGWSWKQWAVLQITVMVIVIGAVWIGSWVGRSEVVQGQRDACVRGQADRVLLQLTNSDQAAMSDIVAGLPVSAEDRRTLRAINDRADERIADLATRLAPLLECSNAFPDPGPLAIPGESSTAPKPASTGQPLRVGSE